MKIVPIKNNSSFKFTFNGIKYISITKKYRNSCVGCLLYDNQKYNICLFVHEKFKDVGLCGKNNIIFIEK